ncbi:hypothetical protein DPMN_054795 [Dreissena polymorpha]|uniref:Uncharacterized protein n=1 Tax=Dreissena polymorpha TaxID=45954 RepID=A0A9D4HTE9_DREPO|nr:hypothetical protein DPMN_054795 [Dreissena polymorpha]
MINIPMKFHDPRQNCPSPSIHVIQLTGTIFELISRIKGTNVLSKFYENWAKNVTSTVFTCFHNIHREKNAPPTGSHVFSPIPTIFKLKTAPPPGGHIFSPIWTIFELVQEINKTNVLTNFHDDWAKIVTSRVKTAIFELGRDFIGAKLLTKFHEDGARNVASRVFTTYVYGRTDGRTYDGQRPVRNAHL